jgi:natural product precursor
MKTKKFNRKLNLNKNTVSNLDNSTMKNIKGGTLLSDCLCSNFDCTEMVLCQPTAKCQPSDPGYSC